MDELVSVITPVYNSEKYISDAIQSVINQTYKNWEMIIVDDCSQDQTQKEIAKISDERIKYIKLLQNSGAAVARNQALEMASGRWIAFLDADDMWKPYKLEKQIAFMKANQCGFSYTAYEIINHLDNKLIQVPSQLTYHQFMKNTIIGTLTVMLDKTIVGDIRIVNVKKDHDSMTWAKLLREGGMAFGLNESLAYYRKLEGSISSNKWKAVKRHWKNCRELEHISFFKCCYYFIFYIGNALKKHYL